VSKRKRPTHSEDELLEQWDFLDAMVDRQASQLRAGIQDSEEVDEPAAAAAVDAVPRAELEAIESSVAALRQEHEALRVEHASLQVERTALRARLAAPPSPAPAAAAPDEGLRREHQSLLAQHETLREQHHALRSEHEALRQQHETAAADAGRLRSEIDSLRAQVAATSGQNTGAELDAAKRRLAEVEAELSRESARRAELVDSLRTAHEELQSLRDRTTQRKPWWKR
jgi:regulator of replication initiation timing